MTRAARGGVVGVLVIALVATAAVLGWLVQERRTASRPLEANTAEAVAATVSSGTLRGEVTGVAQRAAEAVYGYSWRSIADDRAAARELLTGDVLEQYDRTMAGVAGASRANRTVVTATVTGAGVITVREGDAKVLVFVNQRTRGRDLDRPRLNLDRVVVTLVRRSGEWRVSELDAL